MIYTHPQIKPFKREVTLHVNDNFKCRKGEGGGGGLGGGSSDLDPSTPSSTHTVQDGCGLFGI